jgi:hypothetical protein
MATPPERTTRAFLEEIASHPNGEALARLVYALAFSAYDERRPTLADGLDEALGRLGVDEAGAETSWGNAVRALQKRGPLASPERALLGALVARGVALDPPEAGPAAERVAAALAWMGAHTAADPLAALDAALGAGAAPLWAGVAVLLREHDEGALPDRAAAIVAALSLGASALPAAAAVRDGLRGALRDPALAALLGATRTTPAEAIVLTGEETSAPRSPLVTLLLTVTLLLPLVALAKAVGALLLRFRRPAEVSISAEGVRLRSRTELLGETLHERQAFIPAAGLAKAAREVRYPRLATYVGIGTLLCGSYVGIRLVVEGARAGAPEFLGLGLGILLAALAVDYLLEGRPARAPNRCSIVLWPRKGGAFSVRDVEREQADRALGLLAAK